MLQQHPARGEDPLAYRCLPGQVGPRSVDRREDDVDHPVEQLILVRDVFVDRHGHHTKPGCEAAHADGVDAFAVRQLTAAWSTRSRLRADRGTCSAGDLVVIT